MRLFTLVAYAVLGTTALAETALAQTTISLWKNVPAGATSGKPEVDTTTEKDQLIAGKRVQRLGYVSQPTVAFYPAPADRNTGAAVLVFPGGGYRILAYDLEGTEVCAWLNSAGINCVLVKYRVPDAGPFPKYAEDLADAQRAMRITREKASEWKIDPQRVGALGFSAGAHLAAVLGIHPQEKAYAGTDSADQLNARPDFVVLVYPGLLRTPDANKLRAEATPTADTPPTLLIQAEDEPGACGEHASLLRCVEASRS